MRSDILTHSVMLEYFTQNLWLAWLIVSIGLLLLELTSGDFYVICFSFGAVASIIGVAIGLPLWAQVLIWAICSVLCLYFVRPSLVKRLHGKMNERKSNVDALVGREGVVIETIPAGGFGYIKIDGDEWRSVSSDGQEIPVGTNVTVISRDSIILTVSEE